MFRKENDCTGDILKELHEYNIGYDQRTLYLHGNTDNIDGDSGVEYRMANRLIKNINLLDKDSQKILIHQHNIGGEWESGMMIYDSIITAQSYITMVCHGEVMSMGTVILQAADLRLAMPHCTFMFHFGSIVADGNYLEVTSYMELQRKRNHQMLDIYADRCMNSSHFKGKKQYHIKKFLDTKFRNKSDWYLDAEEAKSYGFIDGIIGIDYELKDI